MKSIKIFAFAVATFLATNAVAQHDHTSMVVASTEKAASPNLGKIDTTVLNQINDLLTAYYGVKDALVATDGKKTSMEAKVLLTKLSAIDQSKMTVEQKAFYKPLNEKIGFDAEHINESQAPDHQRDHFGELSTNMLTLVKAFGNKNEAFVQYCPMVKKSWISNNKAVKNPFYGNKMLTCGKVTETLTKK